MQVPNLARLHNDFVNGSLKEEDDNTCVRILLNYDTIKNNFELIQGLKPIYFQALPAVPGRSHDCEWHTL